MADLYGFMQGFQGAQRHISDLKTAESNRQAQAVSTAQAQFNLGMDAELADYRVRNTRAGTEEAERNLKFNRQADPYKLKTLELNFNTMEALQPKMLERAGVQHSRDLVQLQNEQFNMEIQHARTPDQQNDVLAKFNMPYRIGHDGKGNMWETDLQGNQRSPAVPASLFNQQLFNPAAAAAVFTQHALSSDLTQQANAARGGGGMYAMPPDMNAPTAAAPTTAPAAAAPGTPVVQNRLSGTPAAAPANAPVNKLVAAVPQPGDLTAANTVMQSASTGRVPPPPPPPPQRVQYQTPAQAAERVQNQYYVPPRPY